VASPRRLHDLALPLLLDLLRRQELDVMLLLDVAEDLVDLLE
jgi:hypothetical protein